MIRVIERILSHLGLMRRHRPTHVVYPRAPRARMATGWSGLTVERPARPPRPPRARWVRRPAAPRKAMSVGPGGQAVTEPLDFGFQTIESLDLGVGAVPWDTPMSQW